MVFKTQIPRDGLFVRASARGLPVGVLSNNDGCVIARSNEAKALGIAMGALGSDAAIESADVVVMDDNLAKLPRAIKAARLTRTIAMQNIVGALAVKAFFLILGGSGRAGMVEAIVADVGLSLLTVLNSFRLFSARE